MSKEVSEQGAEPTVKSQLDALARLHGKAMTTFDSAHEVHTKSLATGDPAMIAATLANMESARVNVDNVRTTYGLLLTERSNLAATDVRIDALQIAHATLAQGQQMNRTTKVLSWATVVLAIATVGLIVATVWPS